MLKPEELDRLPGTARAIVDKDRQITSDRNRMVSGNVIRFGSHAEMVAHRENLKDRRTLTKRADDIWGKPLRKDGSTVKA